MKWYHSLIAKVTLVFLLAFFGIGALFYSLASHTQKRDIEHTEKLLRVLIHGSHKNKPNFSLQGLFDAGFTVVEDEKLLKKLPFKLAEGSLQRRGRGMGIKALSYKQNIYAHIRVPKERKSIILQSPIKRSILPRVVFPLITFSLLILLYIAIIRSITPLYSLRKKVKAFADGKSDISCTSDKKDEIAALANEFDKSVKKITKLRESRSLFLRNVMHELKTPITKGKLATELLEDSNYKESLQNIFRRQEDLLEEFSRIEKLNANELRMQKNHYNIEDIIDFAMDILPHEPNHVISNISNPLNLNVDFELFGTALKNLLDNGINYSLEKKVFLEINKNTITVSNKAEALEFPLEEYAKPYFLGGKKQQSSRGLGFGLYITWHILKAHGFSFSYDRVGEENKFIIKI